MSGREPPDDLLVESGQPQGVDTVVEEGFPDQRKERSHDLFAERRGVVANLFLGMPVHAEGQKVQQVVQVDLPVGLGVGRERQVLASLFPGDAGLKPLLVNRPGAVMQLGLGVRESVAGFPGEQAL